MMNLKSQVQVILQEADYQTWLASFNGLDAVGFEDDTVMGFACLFPSAEALLEQWRDLETKWLTTHALPLQKAGEKTWNVYSIFLCSERASEVQEREVRWIEEDLERTRKVAACGITDREHLVTTLLPVLPLQYQPRLDTEDFDVSQRLRRRILDIAPGVATVALANDVSPTEIVRLLVDET